MAETISITYKDKTYVSNAKAVFLPSTRAQIITPEGQTIDAPDYECILDKYYDDIRAGFLVHRGKDRLTVVRPVAYEGLNYLKLELDQLV